jgi:CCR4-NOT transcriptional complex subunit CAF120
LLDQRPTSLSAREQEHVARLTNTPLVDLTKNPKKLQKPNATGLTAYIDQREKEKSAAKANRGTSAMQAEIDRRMMVAQQRQMMEMQYMGQQGATTPGGYGAPSMMGAPSVMGGPSMMGTPSMLGTPSMMGTPQGYPQAFAYSTPGQMQQMYQQQQAGYFPQGVSPGVQQGWPSPSPQLHMPGQYPQTPMQGQYFMQQQQQPPVTQPYGASFDQAQAAARFAHQKGQSRRQ